MGSLPDDQPVVIMAETGDFLTAEELSERANRFSHLLRARGLNRGDTLAIFMENNLRYLEVCMAALQIGLYVTAINRYMTAKEASFIMNDSEAKCVVASSCLADCCQELTSQISANVIRLMIGGSLGDWPSYEEALSRYPCSAPEDPTPGTLMLYSSGTTGRPKGIRRALPDGPASDQMTAALVEAQGWTEQSIFLSPAPLYHAAPLGSVLTVLSLGGRVVIMERFDAELFLACIERYHVTHTQVVPTMMVRIMKMPSATRASFDLSTLKCISHAAAPCPVDVKKAMIELLGPIVLEYYSCTEAIGITIVESREWLEHPGTVGRAVVGTLHICDEGGRENPAGETGLIYFERDRPAFSYWRLPEATAAAQHPNHPNWMTVGDIGYIDKDGYLYLTDRANFVIISGGVNIYPQSIESCIISHPAVADVAVVGVPNEELGEEVKAIVQLESNILPCHALEWEILEFCRSRIAKHTVPKSVDFTMALPRLPTGKLYKQALRSRYWPDAPDIPSSQASS